MTLEVCGLAMHHLRMPPNLVTAGLAIILHGEYFLDVREKAALVETLDEWKKQHAWPVQKAYYALGMELDIES